MPDPTSEPFETLIAPELPGLYRAAYRLAGNAADAEDLVQDTCVAACESLTALAAAEHPARWLLRVLYNRFVDGTRRRARSPVGPLGVSAESPALASREPGPEELADRDERERAFHRAWMRLEKTQRALLSLRAEGHGLDEIEAITGVGRDVLRARLHRARRSLARHLETEAGREEDLPRTRRSQ